MTGRGEAYIQMGPRWCQWEEKARREEGDGLPNKGGGEANRGMGSQQRDGNQGVEGSTPAKALPWPVATNGRSLGMGKPPKNLKKRPHLG